MCNSAQVIARAVDAVAYLKSLGCADIEFTHSPPQPHTHTNKPFSLFTLPFPLLYSLPTDTYQVIARAVDAVAYLKSLGCHDIEFTAEDASRSDPDFVCQVVEQVIKAGATTIMIPVSLFVCLGGGGCIRAGATTIMPR
jgi:isopropylmalate/homocitrate/citramalate synthase